MADNTVVDPSQLWERWRSVRAVRNHRIVRIPGDLLTRPTPRILQGARMVCRAISGTRGAQRP